jgi:4-diphosphocytidyl-2-C-methyl-D-erythritol kinase
LRVITQTISCSRPSRALAERSPGITLGAFALDKRLPVAAGLGGGSADAAAALRLIARANNLASDAPRFYEAARATGADVPVCLNPRARVMRGIGELLSEPLNLPPLPAVLVNPGAALATKAVFAGWTPGTPPAPLDQEALTLSCPIARRCCSFSQARRTISSVRPLRWRRLSPKCLRRCAAFRAAWLRACQARARPVSRCLIRPRKPPIGAEILHAKYPQWWVRPTALQ